MASKVDICNMSIYNVGGNPINSVPDGTKKEAMLCDLYYDVALDEVLAAHHWRFAKKWLSLPQINNPTFIDEQYTYVYQLPADFIRFSDQEDRSLNFARREDKLYSNEDTLEIEYIARITDTTKFPIWFTVALTTKLSSYLAIPLSRKGNSKVNWEQLYEYKLMDAKVKDFNEDSQSLDRETKYTTSTDEWIEAR